jgi:hypothetical protein
LEGNGFMDPDLEQLKQHLPLLEYLRRHNWTPRRRSVRQEFVACVPCTRKRALPSMSMPARTCFIATDVGTAAI